MSNILQILYREFVYIWYYFDLQLRQIFWYWVIGMAVGSLISIFAKDRIHGLFVKMQKTRWGLLGIIPACLLGIASPLCMYGTIPIAASFRKQGMREDWLAAFGQRMTTFSVDALSGATPLQALKDGKTVDLLQAFLGIFSFQEKIITILKNRIT